LQVTFFFVSQVGTGGQTTIRVVGTNNPGGETATRAGTAVGQPQKTATGTPGSAQRPQRVQPTSASSQFVQKVTHEGMTVTASGNAGMVGSVKKDTMTMIIDPTTYYTNGAQKMYRLVSVADMENSGHPPRKRMAVMAKPGTSAHHPSDGSASGTRGQLGDDIIIDDGIDERTVVIEQHDSDRALSIPDSDSPLLGDSPLSTMMVSGHQAVPRGSGRHMQLSMSDQLRPQTRVVASPQHHSPSLGAGYLQQSQYDADLQFQQFISQNLSLLNDDEML
ncbi:hypothetical protein OESDEN_23900, partial [Oesophagostomum dentatum]